MILKGNRHISSREKFIRSIAANSSGNYISVEYIHTCPGKLRTTFIGCSERSRVKSAFRSFHLISSNVIVNLFVVKFKDPF